MNDNTTMLKPTFEQLEEYFSIEGQKPPLPVWLQNLNRPKPERYTPALADYTPFHGTNSERMEQVQDHSAANEVRMGIDYQNGKLLYGYHNQGKLEFLVSGHDIIRGVTDSGIVLASPISGEGIKRHLARNYEVDVRALLERLTELFTTHVKLPEDFMPSVFAHWTLGTYLYMVFQYFPYLWITADRENSGKSRAAKILANLCFRGGKVPQIAPTPAVIYRSIAEEGQTFVVDEFDNIPEQAQQLLLAILNAGFENGSTVPRCDQKDYNQITRMPVYCPKVFAGLHMDLPKTFASRTIPVNMLPTAPGETILPFDPKVDLNLEGELQYLRDDMGVWALENARICAEVALRRQSLGMPDYLINRFQDAVVPLFALARVAKTKTGDLFRLCEYLEGERTDDAQQNNTVKLIQVLWDYLDGDTAKIHTETLIKELQKAGVHLNEYGLRTMLRHLKIRVDDKGHPTKMMRIGPGPDNAKRGTQVSRRQLEDLRERYQM